MSKGSTRRPTLISHELEDLRWKLAYHKITFAEYERRYKELKRKGSIKRG